MDGPGQLDLTHLNVLVDNNNSSHLTGKLNHHLV